MSLKIRGGLGESCFRFLSGVVIGTLATLTLRNELTTKLDAPVHLAIEGGKALKRMKTVLIIVAHPDDAEWYTSGTASLLVSNGVSVHLFVASDGERGRGGPGLASVRRSEQEEAARIVGYTSVTFWHLPDRRIRNSPQLESLIRSSVELHKPDAVFTFDAISPSLPYLHPDHEGVGHAVEDEWRRTRGAFQLYRFHSRRPNVVVDITETFETKTNALLSHTSQIGGRPVNRIRAMHRNKFPEVAALFVETFRR